MRDEEARRCRFSGGKAQAARRRQLRLIDNADDDGEALSPEALFDRIQRIARTRRLDDDEARWIETEARKPGRRGRAEFPRKLPRPAPQHPRPNPSPNPGTSHRRGSIRLFARREGIDPANGEASRKTYSRHPVSRRRTTNGRRHTLDFMKGIRLEPSRQKIIASRTAKLPTQPPPRAGQWGVFRDP
jgi:hypothetical protein